MSPAIHLQPARTAPGRTGVRRRGSVLVVALLVAALIALVLGSYLSLNLGAARLSQRTFNRTAAFHLAEAGLEEGLWTYNQLLAGQPRAWDDWKNSGDAAWRRFDGFQLSPSATGTVKVYATPVSPTETSLPTLVSLASVTHPGGAPVTRLLEVTLRRRTLFAAGLVARDRLVFRGKNSTFDSWDSDPDRNPATPAIPYHLAPKLDTGGIATGADEAGDMALNQARIHGYLHTADLLPEVGPTGLIGPFGTPEGTIDPAYLGQDYHDDFPIISAPTDGTVLASFGSFLGLPGQKTSWRAASLSLNGTKTLTIRGHVTLVLTNPVAALSIAGKASLIIPLGSSLTLYAAGDIQIAGNGIVNNNPTPSSLQIWSTEPGSRRQRIAIVGNGALAAVLYAPEADIDVNGNGAVSGSMLGRVITFTGNAAFHYDHALRTLTRHAPYRADSWQTVDDPERIKALLPLVDR